MLSPPSTRRVFPVTVRMIYGLVPRRTPPTHIF